MKATNHYNLQFSEIRRDPIKIIIQNLKEVLTHIDPESLKDITCPEINVINIQFDAGPLLSIFGSIEYYMKNHIRMTGMEKMNYSKIKIEEVEKVEKSSNDLCIYPK